MPHISPKDHGMVLQIGPAPRALIRGSGIIDVRAQAASPDVPTVIKDLAKGFEDFKAGYNARIDSIEQTVNETSRSALFARINGADSIAAGPIDTEYTASFANYARRGATDAEAALKIANGTGERATIQAAFTEGDNSSGGYLAPVEWDRKIQKAQRSLSPMRRLSQVVTTARAAYSTLWSNDLFGSGWVGETAARPATTSGSFTPLIIPSGEIYAMPAASQRLLDDSAINLEEWIATHLSDEFSRQEGIAFVSGDGVNKPLGFLRNVVGGTAELDHPGGALGQTVSGAAAALTDVDKLVDLKYGLGAPYRQNATWLMNSSTAAVIAKMKDGQGNFIWREALLANEPSTLLGRPVEIDESMPNIGAGAFPIAFGDFQRGYLVNDRLGTRILRDPFTSKPFVLFYATRRVGGAVIDPNAIRVMKIAAA
jgi:HK97 family phage major capsid protein